MGALNKLQLGVWGSIASTKLNTYIGGVSAHITTAEELWNRIGSPTVQTGLEISDIKYFTIIGNDVACRIEKEYILAGDAFYKDGSHYPYNEVGFYLDLDNKCVALGGRSFLNQPFRGCKLFNIEAMVNQCFDDCENGYYRFPKLLNIAGFNNFYSGKIARFYAPKCIQYGQSNTADNGNFNTSSGSNPYVLYVHPSMLTINNGSLEPDLAQAVSRGATIVTVDETEIIEEINGVSDLSASNITANSVDLNFTPPTNTYGNDFYLIYADDGSIERKYIPIDEISASGETLSGLTSGTTYKINIVVCDSKWNESALSNQIQITTL